MRRRAPRLLADAVSAVAEHAQPQTRIAAAQRAWPSTVGEAIARESRLVSEREGVVTIACRSATWAAELDLMQEQLRARLNEALDGAPITGMRFVAGGFDD